MSFAPVQVWGAGQNASNLQVGDFDLDGQPATLTPESSMDIQRRLGAEPAERGLGDGIALQRGRQVTGDDVDGCEVDRRVRRGGRGPSPACRIRRARLPR